MFNTGQHITDAIMRSVCVKHGAQKGEPCWHIPLSNASADNLRAICGLRIKHAGYIGKISETSLSSKKTSIK